MTRLLGLGVLVLAAVGLYQVMQIPGEQVGLAGLCGIAGGLGITLLAGVFDG